MLGLNLEGVGHPCLEFILSKGIGNRKKKPKPDSLDQNYYQKYNKYFQTFCGLQPEELSTFQTIPNTSSWRVTLHKVMRVREFRAQLWANLCYLTKDLLRLSKSTQMHNFSSTPMKKPSFKILSSSMHSSINAGRPFRSTCSLSGTSLGSFLQWEKGRRPSLTW